MDLILTLVIGVVAGWLAGMIMKGGGYGIVGDLVVGVVGAYVGSWVMEMLGLAAYGLIGYLITSVIGAVILVAALRVLKKA